MPRLKRTTPMVGLTQWHRGVVVLLAVVAVGCSTDPSPIRTNGSYTSLPKEGTSVLVCADSSVLRETIETWLQRRDVSIVKQPEHEEDSSLCRNLGQEFFIGQRHVEGADQIVVAHSSRAADSNKTMVSVRGLSAQQGSDAWSGVAWDQGTNNVGEEQTNRTIADLACHALATVWRDRPAGIWIIAWTDPCYSKL
ncbi:hypothetical protein YTPLAS18_28280 [Nitrospira sp.]|nr:hypothetical protein YTPLAS18_28280 [Nitrospira sp.]